MMKTVNMTTGIEEIFQGSILIWRAVDSQWLMRDSQSSPETSHLIYVEMIYHASFILWQFPNSFFHLSYLCHFGLHKVQLEQLLAPGLETSRTWVKHSEVLGRICTLDKDKYSVDSQSLCETCFKLEEQE